MKKTLIWLLPLLFLLVAASGAKNTYHSSCTGVIVGDRDFNLKIDDGTVIIKQDNGRDEDVVEITEDYELFINDREVRLTPEQRRYVKDFHGQVFDIIDEGKALGLEGAKLGLGGVEVAFTALAGVVKMIGPDYDEDDLEREVEAKADILEAKADILEERADAIEDMADDLEDIFYDMEDAIPELEKLHLDWP